MGLQNDIFRDLGRKLGDAAEHIRLKNDPIDWIKREFFIPETKDHPDPKIRGHLDLQSYQEDTLREALSRDDDGRYKYSIIIWSDIKKSAKSTIAAAVNLARAHVTEWGEFYIVANDLKQADSRVARYLRRSLYLNPKTNPQKNRDYRLSGYRVEIPNGTFLEAIPIDPSGEAGSNADQITWSELWGSNETAKQRMWAEMTLSPTKQGESFRWVESYAGFAEESDLLYSLYEMGVLSGEMLWPDRLYPVTGGDPAPLELFINKSARMLCLWNTLPRNPWQTKEYYAAEAATLPSNEFERMHRNQWVSSTETFVPMEWWHACKRNTADWPQWMDEEEADKPGEKSFKKTKWDVIIALDAAVSGAALGLWMGCRHPKFAHEVLELLAMKWEPSGPEHKINYYGTQENPGLYFTLKRLLSEYNVIEIVYDEYQMHSFMTRIKEEQLVWCHAYPQGNDRLVSDSLLRDMIRERRYWHQGNPDMEQHVQNADAKIDPEDRKVRIVKRAERLNVDLAVCAAMGCRELMRLNL